MTQREIERLLEVVFSPPPPASPREHRDKTLQCPSLPRFRDLIYRPSTMTPEELRHMRPCRYCRMTLQLCEREAYHPPAAYLMGAPIPTEEEATAVVFHRERLHCERCQGVTHMLETLQQLEQRPEYLVWGGPKALPSSRLDWQEAIAPGLAGFAAERPRFLGQYPSEDGTVMITVRETDVGDLMLHVDTQAPALQGTLWRVTLLRESNQVVQVVFLVLYPGFDAQRWGAEIRLGHIAEVAQQVVQGFSLHAYPLPAESLTAEDTEPFYASIMAMAENRRATAEWEAFITQSLGRALPAPVAELLREAKAHLEQSRGSEGAFGGVLVYAA